MSHFDRHFDRLAGSKANYWGGIFADTFVSLALLGVGFGLGALVPCLVAVACGATWYSFGEYAIHRWTYHSTATVPSMLHAYHHDEQDAVYSPPFYYTLTIAFVHGAVLAPFTGVPAALAFAGALLFGYAQQSVIHHSAHRYPHLDVLGVRSRLRRHHAVHHAGGNANFGVSTTLWDRVFGTLR